MSRRAEDEVLDAIDEALEEISGPERREIEEAVEDAIDEGVIERSKDGALATTTKKLLDGWGAASVDSYMSGDDAMVEFYPPFPGDQPIRSNITYRNGGLRKATIRYGVLDRDAFDTHPQNDPEQIGRLVETVRRAGAPPDGVQIVANFGDDHYPPRPHLLLAWAPFGAHAYGGEQYERELVHEGDEEDIDVSPASIVDYAERVGDEIGEEFADDYVDHRPDDSFPSGPPEAGIDAMAQRRIDRLERGLNNAAARMGVGPVEQNSYTTEFDRGVVTLAVRTAKTMDSNPSDFVIDASTGVITDALVRFEDLPIEPPAIVGGTGPVDMRIKEAVGSVDAPDGVRVETVMAAGHVGKTPHLEFEQVGDLPPKELADYIVEVDEAIKEEFAPEREGQKGYDLSDPTDQRRALDEVMEQSYAYEIHEALKAVFGDEYEEVTVSRRGDPDDRRVDMDALVDKLQSESDDGRGTAMWIIEEIEDRGVVEDYERPEIARVPKSDGNHTAIITRDDYRISLGGANLRDLSMESVAFTDMDFKVDMKANVSTGINTEFSGVGVNAEVTEKEPIEGTYPPEHNTIGNMGSHFRGLPGDEDDIEGSSLSHLWVDPDHRGEGIGQLLFDIYLLGAAWAGGTATGGFGEDSGGSRRFLNRMGIDDEDIRDGGGGWVATASVSFRFDIEDFVADHDWIEVTVS